MTRNTLSFVVIASVFVFYSCGEKNANEKNSEAVDKNNTEKTEETKRFSINDIKPGEPIAVNVANAKIMCWNEKIVDVAGYVYTFYGDSASIDYGNLTLLMGKGSNKQSFSVSMKDNSKKFKVHKNDMIHLRGRITGTYFDSLVSMRDAEIIAIAPSIKTESLDETKSGRVFDAGELNKDYTQWNNREITVKGNYMMTTTSTTSYGVTIRVDLKHPESQYADVGCDFKEDPSALLENSRQDVIVTGKIQPGGAFGRLHLYDCKLVNR